MLIEEIPSHSDLWPTEHTEDTEEDLVSVYSVCSVGNNLFVPSVAAVPRQVIRG